MIRLLVVADDRTGALETAGACAQVGCGDVPVGVAAMPAVGGAVVVVDIESRHDGAARASALAAACESWTAERYAHKIDSTLRGHWAVELVARQIAGRRRVVVVPAFPQLGRTCSMGVVLEHGRPVADGAASSDARTQVTSSRPADHLLAAGAGTVAEIVDAAAFRSWLDDAAAPPFAVCDADDDAQLRAIGAMWAAHRDVVFAGTSRSIALAAAMSGSVGPAPIRPDVGGPALVVCASLHPTARRQVEVLAARGGSVHEVASAAGEARQALSAGGVVVVISPEPARRPVSAGDASSVAANMADATRELLAAVDVGTLVLIGGDTAAAVLGTDDVVVGGLMEPGVPHMRIRPGGGPLVLTRAGGFGDDSSLVVLLADVLV